MIDLHNLSAAAGLLMGACVGAAYFPSFKRRPRPVAKRLVWGGTLVIVGAVIRSNYWSNVRLIAGDAWPHLRDSIGGLNVNVMSDLVIVAGFYLFLSAKLHAIPLRERKRYNVFTAIRYPYPCCFPSMIRRGR